MEDDIKVLLEAVHKIFQIVSIRIMFPYKKLVVTTVKIAMPHVADDRRLELPQPATALIKGSSCFEIHDL